MARKVKDLAVVTGTYAGSDGQEKRRYMNCGALMENDEGGQFIMLSRYVNYSALPRKQGSDSILISVFDLREREDGGEQPKPAGLVDTDLDDDVPF